ncbi:MAG: hypothetical protein HY721_25075 [Planctomycetes bacterium]|nr:hypothetical protein [Planctomycetota bacterium]
MNGSLLDLKTAVAALLAAPALVACVPARAAEGEFSAEDAARLFRGSCGKCHAAPDPREDLDRAWLDQVHRTS